jgi:hypothetical protein
MHKRASECSHGLDCARVRARAHARTHARTHATAGCAHEYRARVQYRTFLCFDIEFHASATLTAYPHHFSTSPRLIPRISSHKTVFFFPFFSFFLFFVFLFLFLRPLSPLARPPRLFGCSRFYYLGSARLLEKETTKKEKAKEKNPSDVSPRFPPINSSCIRAVFVLYSCCIRAVFVLYSCYIRAIFERT